MHVKEIGSATSTSGTTNIVVPAAGVAAGALIVVRGNSAGGLSDHISSISDSAGNTYVKAVEVANGNTIATGIWYAENVSALSENDQINVTWKDTGQGKAAVAHEVSDILTSLSLDKTASATGTSTSPASGSVTLAQNEEFLMGAFAWSSTGSSLTAGSGWTEDTEQHSPAPFARGGGGECRKFCTFVLIPLHPTADTGRATTLPRDTSPVTRRHL